MKKITVLTFFALLLSGAMFFACSKQNEDSSNVPENSGTNLRSEFLKGKNQDEIIASFGKLTPVEKTNLWLEKTDQLLTLNLPNEHKVLLNKLKYLIQHNNEPKKLDEFRTALVDFAKITPLEDFSLMVEKLDDYKYDGKFNGKTKISAEVLNDLKNLGKEPAVITNNTGTNKLTLPKCNCRYICWMYGGSSGDCQETVDGCGPFGMSTCNGHV
jgi:hypothetical protein